MTYVKARELAGIFQPIPTPPDVTHVEGCDCGGVEIHRTDCSIWHIPHEQRQAAIEEAEERIRQHSQALTDRNRAFLDALVAGQQDGRHG